MTPDRWRKAQEIFLAATEREAPLRVAFLDEACRDDPELRKEVDSLLSSFEATPKNFLESPAIEGVPALPPTAAAEPRLLRRGAQLGPYEILDSLGAGGMGEVYRARDPRLGREVAIKVLSGEAAADRDRLRRFEKEARSASALNHPNIVTIYEIGSEGDLSYIAMERVDGETLRELLTHGALAIRKLLQIAPQIADGLAKAHEAGIVHRDLKPENVMVTKDGLVKILDFGIAKLTAAEPGGGEESGLPMVTGTTPGLIVGTAGYMSPEQARGEPVDFRSDQFSFGSVLYEMATGKHAFKRGTAVHTLAAILDEDPEPIAAAAPRTPVPVCWIIERCLAKDPGARYASTKDLVRDLTTTRDHLADTATQPAGWTLPPPSRTRFRVAAWTLASLVSVLAGALLGRLLWKAPPSHPSFHQVTFRAERIETARFAPDGHTIVYGSDREGGPFELFSTRVGSLESRPMGLAADVLSISSFGEMAILLGGPSHQGTLARSPLAGGAPREILGDVRRADWSPDGKLLTAVHVVGGRERLESPIGTVLYESTGSIGPPYVSRTGNRILFQDGGSLAIVDPTRKVIAVGETLAPSGYGWSAAGDEVWMTVIVGSTTEVRALRPGGRERMLATFPGSFILQDVARNGGVLADRIAQHAPMMCRAPGETLERDLSWLDSSVPADISADGKTVLFTEAGVGGGESRSVFLRGTDGVPAIRLGEGHALALSPDGKWALSRRNDRTILLPTAAGEPRTIAATGVDFERGATFYPDGRLLLSASSPGHGIRLFSLKLGDDEPHPMTPDGVLLPEGAHTVSPDGKSVAASDLQGTWSIYPLEGSTVQERRPIAGLLAREGPIRWSTDGRFLFVAAESGNLDRLDPVSGQRETVRQFRRQSIIFPTPNGVGYVYGSGSESSHLFLIEGLR
jgi:serine/threonine protein kinase/Tol biopolymer transport system component